MSISGEHPGEGSDGEEEVFINEEDILHEITVDDEGYFRYSRPCLLAFSVPAAAYSCLPCLSFSDLPDRDDDDEEGGDGMGTPRI